MLRKNYHLESVPFRKCRIVHVINMVIFPASDTGQVKVSYKPSFHSTAFSKHKVRVLGWFRE
jgi:hypothetical protein